MTWTLRYVTGAMFAYALTVTVTTFPSAQAVQPRALLERAINEFEQGQIDRSVTTFDDLVKVAPGAAPELWQRGIALYYAGRYADCRQQF